MSAKENLSQGQFPEHTYQYEVSYAETHEDMQAGKSKTSYISVQAANEQEANLTAAQMSARHGHVRSKAHQWPEVVGEAIPTATKRLG